MMLLIGTFVAVQSAILGLVNKAVPDDYMDEIFHGPQAREYCRGAFTSWHPKITTFPGIYYLGTLYGWARWAVQAAIQPVSSWDAACSTAFLRSLNVLLSAACLAVLHGIISSVRQPAPPTSPARAARRSGSAAQAVGSQQAPGPAGLPEGSRLGACAPQLHALVLALYPLHWFFSFLYYTDVAALLFLLVCDLQALRRRYWAAGLAGAAAVLCRQTNAVWVAFVLGEAALAELGMDLAPALRRQSTQPQGHGQGTGPGTSTGKAGSSAGDAGSSAGVGQADASSFALEVSAALSALWKRRGHLAAALWPLALPPTGFAAYMVANGGSVVLGDKEAHKPVRHGAQLLYFAAWAALMLWPQVLPYLAVLAGAVRRAPVRAAVVAAGAMAAAAAIGHVSTLVHPYMLADNRHYVFYLWRRILGRSASAKYALAPLYAGAWALLLIGLLRRMSRLWVLGFLACLTVTLLPAWLLELRYFTPALYLIALRLQPPTRLQALALLATYGAIDAATMFLFLHRPYTFADGSVARFLW